jgi:hypothetical protein
MSRLLWLFACYLVAVSQTASATSISPAGFAADAQLIDFDSVSGALTGAEFGVGLTLRSGPAVEPDADKVPANFVVTETEFPGAMASPPNKITGAQVTGEGCKFCSIIIGFDTPRAQVGFWVADPDFGQYAEFIGPSGLLDTLSVTTHDSGSPFFIGFEDPAGIIRVEIHSVTWLGLGIDDLMFSSTTVPEASSAVLLAVGLVGAIVSLRARCPANLRD